MKITKSEKYKEGLDEREKRTEINLHWIVFLFELCKNEKLEVAYGEVPEPWKLLMNLPSQL